MVKVTKFEKIKKDIEEIVEEYKEAKNNNDEVRMAELEDAYNNQRIKLNSNDHHFKTLKRGSLKKQKEELNDEKKINNINIKLRQKKVYSDNKSYIDMVWKSENIDQYIENSSHKKRNFVKRPFKKFALGISLAAALIAGGTLLSKKNNKDNGKFKDVVSNIETTIDSTDDYKNDDSAKINTSGEKIVIEGTTEENTKEETNREERVTDVNTETSVVITPQNPNIELYNTQPIIEENILPENTTEEPQPEDYKSSTEEETEEESEIVTTEEETTPDNPDYIEDDDKTPIENTTEEDKDIVIIEEETTPDNPDYIEDDDKNNTSTTETNPSLKQESNEKVTIIEREETEPLDNPTIIESDEKDVIYYEGKSETTNSTIEETNPSLDENIPIEEDEEDVIYYENLDILDLDTQDILNSINNETEIGMSYTLHM